eukprot:SM005791S18741  [mRNA]  locus=s5791:92:876:+ [translate_table: standard]
MGRQRFNTRGLPVHAYHCRNRQNREELAASSQVPRTVRPPPSPSSESWHWAATVDLTPLFIPDGLRNLRHIPRWARRECTKVLTPYLACIEADSMDEAAWALYTLFPKLVLRHPFLLRRRWPQDFPGQTGCIYKWEMGGVGSAACSSCSDRALTAAGAQWISQSASQQSTAGNLARARLFGRAGELSRATQALCPDPLATTNDATEAISNTPSSPGLASSPVLLTYRQKRSVWP